MICEIEDCSRDVNRDGLCLHHKLKTVSMSTAQFTMEREGKGWGINPEGGTRENVERMYEQRRKDGLPDPIPENSEAAKFAPAQGPVKPKVQEKLKDYA